jgi:hypothetical protein
MREFSNEQSYGVRRLATSLRLSTKSMKPFVVMGASILIAALWAAAARPDQPTSDTIGAIEGETIAVQGPVNVDMIGGQVKTVLRSGSDVQVKSGHARINLVEGGQIAVCGPAHFSVLKSAGALTLALDTGTIHARIEREPALTIYTPQLLAKPIAIGDSPQDLLVGFDATGAMCVRAASGAVRLEAQLTGQSIVVPQSGDISISGGQLETLRNTPGNCLCELQVAKAVPAPPPPPEVSRPATPEEVRNRDADAAKAAASPKAPAKEEPIYQVLMPPLSYDATAKVQRDNFDPQLILLVRRVRVRPTLIFQGRVEAPPAAAQAPVAKQEPPATASAKSNPPSSSASKQTDDSLIGRVRAFFRRLFS